MTRPVRVILCPGAQAKGDSIGAGMGADTSRLRIRSANTAVKYIVVLMLLMIVFWQ